MQTVSVTITNLSTIIDTAFHITRAVKEAHDKLQPALHELEVNPSGEKWTQVKRHADELKTALDRLHAVLQPF